MKTKFEQIFNFQYQKPYCLENSLYLEDLTGLLSEVASRIDDESAYFWGDEFYLNNNKLAHNNSFKFFSTNLQNSFYHGSSEKINIIRGRAGIGKSLFFERGIQRLVRNSQNHGDNYIFMGVDFKNIDSGKDVSYYEKIIYEKLRDNATDCIHILGKEIYASFKQQNEEYRDNPGTPHAHLFPLKFFCEKINRKYDNPCIIVFDNIDLASAKTQKNVFDATVNICNAFNKYMKIYGCSNCYRIYFVMRPETHPRYNEGKWGAVIDFPLPNILKISLAIIHKVLLETAQKFDEEKNLSCNVTCVDVLSNGDKMISLRTFTDVAQYFYRILDYFLGDIWTEGSHAQERLGTSVEFHCNIVNYNLRIFLRFLADTISNGGFKPLTKEFNQRQSRKYYSIYDYIGMIIQGRWRVHPGNKYIDGEGGNKAPIVFNIFDTNLYGHNSADKIKHFMLNIRILQYFSLYEDNCEVSYSDMESDLGHFFAKEHICNATKKLIYVHLLYSQAQGDEAIASLHHWKDIVLDNNTPLESSPAGQFYLKRLICEFEYLYQMALSSLMCESYVNLAKECWKTEKEIVVLYFLKSIFEIIRRNIYDYTLEELPFFKKLFCNIDDIEGSKPFRRMLDGFVSVMSNKTQRAMRMKTSNKEKLNGILIQAQNLKRDVETFLESNLGD